MAARKKATARRKPAGKSVTTRSTSDDMPTYMDSDSNRGSENVTSSDLIIPRIGLIQALSPQRKKTHAAYIEGAEEGLLFNSVTNELYGDHINFIPVYFKKEHVIWRDRDSGGGFRGAYDTLDQAQAAYKDLEDKDVCEIIETDQHFVLIDREDGELEEAIISMSVSKMTASRKLNSLCRIAGGDRFSRRYRLDAVVAEGKKGEYQNYSVKMLDGFVTKDQYEAGEKMYDNITAGKRAIDREADVQ